FRYTYTVLSALLIITETGPVGDLSGFQSNCPAEIGSLSWPLREKNRPGCTVVPGAECVLAMITVAPFIVTPNRSLENSSGSRTHPWESGYPGRSPACNAIPPQVTRSM